jgi:thiol:disulfide interchange protein DsbC
VYAIKASHPRMPKLTMFVTKDKKIVILGNGFDANNGKIIEFPTDMSIYKADKLYTIGNGKKEYYLFTDPECPYCKKFEKQMDKLKDDIKIHVFLFPLDFHKNSISMSKYIISQKTSKDRMIAAKDIADNKTDYKNAKYTSKENEEMLKLIDRHKKIGIDVGVAGTPAVFSATGKTIAWPSLLKK